MSPRDRCLAAMEAQRILRQVWAAAASDHERMLLENILVTLRAYLRELCKDHNIPFE